MADLDAELRQLGGGGRRGAALSLLRFWPAAALGLMVPGTLNGSAAALAVMVLAGGTGALMTFTDSRLQGRATPLDRLVGRRSGA